MFSFPLKDKKDCESKPDTGPCKGKIPRIYFDKTDKRCKKFTYGGCGGNCNNYKTKNECLETCSGTGKHGIQSLHFGNTDFKIWAC